MREPRSPVVNDLLVHLGGLSQRSTGSGCETEPSAPTRRKWKPSSSTVIGSPAGAPHRPHVDELTHERPPGTRRRAGADCGRPRPRPARPSQHEDQRVGPLAHVDAEGAPAEPPPRVTPAGSAISSSGRPSRRARRRRADSPRARSTASTGTPNATGRLAALQLHELGLARGDEEVTDLLEEGIAELPRRSGRSLSEPDSASVVNCCSTPPIALLVAPPAISPKSASTTSSAPARGGGRRWKRRSRRRRLRRFVPSAQSSRSPCSWRAGGARPRLPGRLAARAGT